jgi:hypothetical protein
MRRILYLCLALMPAACNGSDGGRVSRDAPPAAAVVAPGMETETLSDQLRDLSGELARASEGEPDRVLTAEAITDRLIHAERPVDWLASGYDVEARLRQLQAMADRVVARLRRGASLEEVEEDIATMAAAARDLETQLTRPGGGEAPPTLDSLLAQDPLRDVQAASLTPVMAARDSAEASRDPLPDIEPRVAPVQSGGILGRPVRRDTTP